MNKARRHDMVQRLSEVQGLRVAREQLHLMDAQQKTASAAERAEQGKSEHIEAQSALDQLMAQEPFCPTNYRIACEHVLITNAVMEEQKEELQVAEAEEAQQRIEWHQQRQQANWLDEEARSLAKKLARTADEKRATEAMALIWHAKEAEA